MRVERIQSFTDLMAGRTQSSNFCNDISSSVDNVSPDINLDIRSETSVLSSDSPTFVLASIALTISWIEWMHLSETMYEAMY